MYIFIGMIFRPSAENIGGLLINRARRSRNINRPQLKGNGPIDMLSDTT